MKIGLFICNCGKNISGTIDTKRLLEHFKEYTDLHILGNQYLCAELGLNELSDEIKKMKIDRVIRSKGKPNQKSGTVSSGVVRISTGKRIPTAITTASMIKGFLFLGSDSSLSG